MKMNLPSDVKMIIERLEQAGFEGYAVGGCVRDTLLGKEPKDWDITTSAKPEEVKALFPRTIDTGIQHGTVTVMENHVGYEVTTYRIDGEYEDSRHPKEVTFTANLAEDLKRRDFTINAMAYSDRGGLVDLFGGEEDLKRGLIRCVGEPEERFTEDALRMLRAIRFSAQLGFAIDPATEEAIRTLAPTLKKISAERITAETIKTICSDNPRYFEKAYSLGLTGQFLPEFDLCMETMQHSRHHMYTVGMHSLVAMDNIANDKILRLTMLLHDIAKPLCITVDEQGKEHYYGHPEKGAEMAKEILRRFKLDNDTIARVTTLIRWHDDRTPVSPRATRRMINRIGVDVFPDLFLVKYADVMAQSLYEREEKLGYIDNLKMTYEAILAKNQCVQIKDLAVDGRDLIAAGAAQGKQIGQCLQALLDQVLEDPALNDRETLLAMAKDYLQENHADESALSPKTASAYGI